jgi:hypothetical protein
MARLKHNLQLGLNVLNTETLHFFNLLTPELNSSAKRYLTIFFTWDFAS